MGRCVNCYKHRLKLCLQDLTVPYFGEGIPFYFHGYRRDGRLVARGMPRGGRQAGRYLGERIAHAGPAD